MKGLLKGSTGVIRKKEDINNMYYRQRNRLVEKVHVTFKEEKEDADTHGLSQAGGWSRLQ